MTVSVKIDDKHKVIMSDTTFQPMCKKPTMSVYDSEKNVETKVASFNSQETFEWFIGLLGVKEESRNENNN